MSIIDKWIASSFVAAFSVFQMGCEAKDGCQEATERIMARYVECKLTLSTTSCGGLSCDALTEECVVMDGGGINEYRCVARACTTADAKYMACAEDCIESASCEALGGGQGLEDYTQCLAICG